MTEFIKKITPNVKDDVLAGITVSLAMIPEVVAFAFVAQIDPLVALSGAFIIGLITAIFGGRPGLISGAAGAVAVIFVSMISEGHTKGMLFDTPIDNMGYFYLLACVILMGIIQILAGVFKLGKFVRLIPHPVMMGFVNGLAIVIFWAQVKMFSHKSLSVSAEGVNEYVSTFMQGSELMIMIGLVTLTMGIIWVLPKITKKNTSFINCDFNNYVNCSFFWLRSFYSWFLYYRRRRNWIERRISNSKFRTLAELTF